MSDVNNAPRKGIYLLPSLFTMMGLFAGFYALIAAIQGKFELAAWAIIAAAVFDMLDGRVARLLHAETDFGAELDSLCDMTSFGLAPAVLLYLWALPTLGKLGWLAAFLIAACSALRLARFNVRHDVQDKNYFQGLPTPATALLIASAVLFHEQSAIAPVPWLWGTIGAGLAWLMVSNVRFISGKDIDLKQKRSFTVLVIILAAMVLVMVDPYRILFAVFLAYVLHGPMLSLWQNRKTLGSWTQRRSKKQPQEHQNDTPKSTDGEG